MPCLPKRVIRIIRWTNKWQMMRIRAGSSVGDSILESRPLAWRVLARFDRQLDVSTRIGESHDVILMYHSVGGIAGTEYPWDIPPDLFRRQVRLMCEAFEPVPLPKLVAESADERRVAVTFDDGYRNVYTNAVPVLRDFGVPATVFVCPDLIGDMDEEVVRERLDLNPEAQNILMTPEQLQSLADSTLFELGSHTETHVDLSTVTNEEELREEIGGANDHLRDRFGVAARGFSYPYGGVTERAADVVADNHDFAVTTEPGPVRTDDDIYRLPRVDTTTSPAVLRFESTALGDRLRRLAHFLGV